MARPRPPVAVSSAWTGDRFGSTGLSSWMSTRTEAPSRRSVSPTGGRPCLTAFVTSSLTARLTVSIKAASRQLVRTVRTQSPGLRGRAKIVAQRTSAASPRLGVVRARLPGCDMFCSCPDRASATASSVEREDVSVSARTESKATTATSATRVQRNRLNCPGMQARTCGSAACEPRLPIPRPAVLRPHFGRALLWSMTTARGSRRLTASGSWSSGCGWTRAGRASRVGSA